MRIVIFGSGKGSNTWNLLKAFANDPAVNIVALVTDKPRRGFLDISYEYRVNLEIIKGSEMSDPKWINHLKLHYRPDYILLLGFLQKVPVELIASFEGRIINMHPALLPAFGGEGMYGKRVHEAVIAANVKQSGITFHVIDSEYDRGEILRQYSIQINEGESAETLETRIHQLEQEKLPEFVRHLKDL